MSDDRAPVAVVGPGHLLVKRQRSERLRVTAMVGWSGPGGSTAPGRSASATTCGVDALLADDDRRELVFEATSAAAHRANTPRYAQAGLRAVDLTPGHVGPMVFPAVAPPGQVRDCWGSLFTARALRLRRGISHDAMPIAVGVIELVHARASGVAFSVHPVTGRADRIVIETSWGWGEAIVQGLVDPDHVEVGKSDDRVLKYDTAHKAVVSAFDFAVGVVTEIAMPAKLADRRVLDPEQISAVAAAVRSIEDHYGYPVDVEWVISRHRRAGDPVCIVQTRPVTATKVLTCTPAPRAHNDR